MNAIIGLLTGLAASMGLGGGFILIIYLTVFGGIESLTARAANLVFFIPIAVLSVILHGKNGLIEWRIMPRILVSGVIGAAAGTLLGLFINPRIIEICFGVLIAVTGIRELFHRKKTAEKQDITERDES